MLLLMTANRINQAVLSSTNVHKVLRLLKELKTKLSANEADRLRKEIQSQSDNLAAILANRRHYSKPAGQGVYEVDPRFLLFEYCHGLLLRESQVNLVHKLLGEVEAGRSVCHQMIMGAGKTTVVGPLLSMLLANATTLVFEVVPSALLDFSAGVLRERFGAAIRKPIFTFTFDRYNQVTPQLLAKLRTARNLRAVVVSTPSSIKAFMLKFIETCHNLNRQQSIESENTEVMAEYKRFTIRNLLGMGPRRTPSTGMLSIEEIRSNRSAAALCEKIFEIMRTSIEIMDEVDIILHPLKSELNWPLGTKDPLDFTRARVGTGLRWSIPSHLFDAIFSCCGMPIVADVADSRVAINILERLESVIQEGFTTLQLQKSPHLTLLSRNFYDEKMRPIICDWAILLLRKYKLSELDDQEVTEFLVRGQHSHPQVIAKIKQYMGDDHTKMLNLSHDWITSYLPFCLMKVNRVSFGLLQSHDISQLEADGVKIPQSRKLSAVPFVAKDVPSRASEFAHPDVLIGLTVLAYRYEGLRKRDFYLVMRHLKDEMDDEGGPYEQRHSCQRFEQWILCAGKTIRGSKKREKNELRSMLNNKRRLSGGGAGIDLVAVKAELDKTREQEVDNNSQSVNIFCNVFAHEDDLIWPLQLVDEHDHEQFKVLYPYSPSCPTSLCITSTSSSSRRCSPTRA